MTTQQNNQALWTECLEAAAQVWCRDDCKHIAMDATLAYAIADVIYQLRAMQPEGSKP